MNNYDAILFLSFGGPEGMNDVMPFLANVLRGKNVPQSRMLEVAHHYEQFGGVSPINGQNRALIAALEKELKNLHIDLPVYWGNRNWHPMLADTLKKMRNDGIKRAMAFVTSAYSSYSGCRQYLEDIDKAKIEAGAEDIQIDKLPVFYQHPLFLEGNFENVQAGLDQLTGDGQTSLADVEVAFTAHSIPMAMASNCDYVKQLSFVCEAIVNKLGIKHHKLVFQSRSGPPSQPWLEPDIADHMRHLKESRPDLKKLLVHPVGFISDHMEILYDLDTEAKQLAHELDMQLVRTSTTGTNQHFAKMMAELVQEQLRFRDKAAGNVCAPGCCAYTPAGRPSSGA